MKKNYLTLLLLLMSNTFSQAQNISKIYEQVNPAVVVVYAEERTIVDTGDETPKMMSTINKLGSGFMISKTEIITAANLIHISDVVYVQFLDGTSVPARVTGINYSADIAMISLDKPKEDAVTVSFGNSNELRHGQPVFVVIAPDHLEHSMSVGAIKKIVKGETNRQVKTIDYLQTTTPIEADYVGGPMFNLKGEVIGLVGHLLSANDGFEAIPYIITANSVQDRLFEKTLEWNGIDARPLTGNIARRHELPQMAGLLVERVESNSPLGMMGLQKKDIILSFTDIKFEMKDETLSKMGEISYELQPHEAFDMMVYRGEKVVFLNRY